MAWASSQAVSSPMECLKAVGDSFVSWRSWQAGECFFLSQSRGGREVEDVGVVLG